MNTGAQGQTGLNIEASSYYARIYSLVCEGKCNPQIADVDQMVRRFRKGLDVKNGGGFTKDRDMILIQRTLRHTDHAVGHDDTQAFCMVCGTKRRYGGNPLLGPAR